MKCTRVLCNVVPKMSVAYIFSSYIYRRKFNLFVSCVDFTTMEVYMIRYNACWLPLLAKHTESRVFEGPLVVPLDCEWIWHCHRLNPVRFSPGNSCYFLLFISVCLMKG
jgi:hypothetical protein